MILKAKHHNIIYPFFRMYTRHLLKKHFNNVHLIGDYVTEKLPVLLLANHFSWWDGFFAMYLNLKVLKKKFHFMMLEEQLRRYWFFKYSGGFSVKRKSKSIIESLNYASELLNSCSNMVLIFPQGEIRSMHCHSFKFEKGTERILRNRTNKVQVVFLAVFVDYLSNKKPDAYMYFSVFSDYNSDIEAIQQAYNHFYSESVKKQNQLKE